MKYCLSELKKTTTIVSYLYTICVVLLMYRLYIIDILNPGSEDSKILRLNS